MDALDPEELRRLYWDDALTIAQVARRLRVSKASLIAAMVAHGIPRRPRGQRPVVPDPATLAHAYCEQQQTVRGVAATLQISYRSVQRALVRYGIARRPPLRRRTAITDRERSQRAYVAGRFGVAKAARLFRVSRNRLVAQTQIRPRMRGTTRVLNDAAVRDEYVARQRAGEPVVGIVTSIAARCRCHPSTVWRSLQRTEPEDSATVDVAR